MGSFSLLQGLQRLSQIGFARLKVQRMLGTIPWWAVTIFGWVLVLGGLGWYFLPDYRPPFPGVAKIRDTFDRTPGWGNWARSRRREPLHFPLVGIACLRRRHWQRDSHSATDPPSCKRSGDVPQRDNGSPGHFGNTQAFRDAI